MADRRSDAKLSRYLPRFRGVEGISVFRAEDYLLEAKRWSIGERGDAGELVRFLELAVARHRAAIDRQARENLMLYGTTELSGRNRFLKARMRDGNLAAIRSLELELANRQESTR